jgi:nuclear transport factor 2 (NTF2) superfamily protein
MTRPPLPPFTAETAAQKARLAEDAWNTRDPAKVALGYTLDSIWRNRAEFIRGREAIEAFLTRKWNRELDYRLIKEVWAFRDNRIAVRFAYEWHDDSGNWFRSYGNENWEFDEQGLMRWRIASINDLPIKDGERKYHWPLGRRPDDHPPITWRARPLRGRQSERACSPSIVVTMKFERLESTQQQRRPT